MCRRVPPAQLTPTHPALPHLPTPLSPPSAPALGQVVRGGEEKQQQLLAADFPIARMFREMSSWAHLPADDESTSRKEEDP